MIDGLCQRYHCPPSQILEEDSGLILQMMKILDAAGDNEQPE